MDREIRVMRKRIGALALTLLPIFLGIQVYSCTSLGIQRQRLPIEAAWTRAVNGEVRTIEIYKDEFLFIVSRIHHETGELKTVQAHGTLSLQKHRMRARVLSVSGDTDYLIVPPLMDLYYFIEGDVLSIIEGVSPVVYIKETPP
jgi:hypothetical protein